jgi:phosphatidylglycerol---prolipoprotein diacylglyceryl transferase
MIVHNFNPVLFDLGIVQIRWYSIAYILGILLGWFYANIIIKKKIKNNYNLTSIKTSEFDDLIIYLIIGIIVGGRLGYTLFYNFEFYSKNILESFKIWNGGMSFHGGLIGVIIATFIFSKKIKTNFFKFTDILACVAPIGFFLGRIANYINGELFGKATNLPWAVIFPHSGMIGRHPSQIYEALLEGVVLFFLINFLAIKKQLIIKTGYVSGIFLVSYSILRIFSELFREPDKQIGYLFNYISMGTLLSAISLLAGLIILYIKKNEPTN